jgi:hypothetical protein
MRTSGSAYSSNRVRIDWHIHVELELTLAALRIGREASDRSTTIASILCEISAVACFHLICETKRPPKFLIVDGVEWSVNRSVAARLSSDRHRSTP